MKIALTKAKKKNLKQASDFSELVSKINRRRGCKVFARKKKGKALTFTLARPQRMVCTPQEYFQAGFCTPPNPTHAALQLGISTRSVVRMRMVLAAYILKSQLRLLDSLIGIATLCPPLFCISREAWDETGHVCTFRTEHDNPDTEGRARWEVMVLRISICIGWEPRIGRQPMFYECVIPPMVLPTTSASSMHDTLRSHPSFMEFNERLHKLRSLCTMRGYVQETDAAYSNEKLVAFFMGMAPSAADHFLAWKACHNHKNMHVEGMTMGAIGTKLVGSLYSMCSFLSSSSHWPRMMRSLGQWSRMKAQDVSYHVPTAQSRQLAASIVEYYMWNDIPFEQGGAPRKQRWVHKVGRDPLAQTQAGADKHAEWVAGLRIFLQTTYNNLGPGESVHCCSGGACCPSGSSSLSARLEAGMRQYILRRQPSPPSCE